MWDGCGKRHGDTTTLAFGCAFQAAIILPISDRGELGEAFSRETKIEVKTTTRVRLCSLIIRRRVGGTCILVIRCSLEVELALYLYTNELPHLRLITFFQRSHFLGTRMNWHTENSKCDLWSHGYSWILRDVCSETKRIMTLHLLACKCVGTRLTSKTCHPLGSISTELAQ